MSKRVFRLDDEKSRDIMISGGKGANLCRLIKADFPVPPGFVISASACRDYFESINIETDIEKLNEPSLKGWEDVCEVIRDKIISAEIMDDLSRNILTFYDDLAAGLKGDSAFAVRSSATAEDLGEASFAGQHATYYYVGRENLLSMVKHCWASLFSYEAVSYRDAQGVRHDAVFMAVIVQQMIRSEISGITFTADPVTGDADRIIIESSWGMGAAIVDGRVTPDRYIFSRDGQELIEKRIADKQRLVPPDLDKGSHGRLRDVPHEKRQVETLAEDTAREIAGWGVRAEEHFGRPQDMEWALSGGRLYILQSRPITVMGRLEADRDVKGKYVLFKAVAENFMEPITPLTQDIIDYVKPPGFLFINSRAYVDLRILKALLPFKGTDEELALSFYEMSLELGNMKFSRTRLLIMPLMLFFGYMFFGLILARTRKMPDDFMDGYRELCRTVDEDDSYGPAETITRLWSWSWLRFFEPMGNMVVFVNLSSVRYMIDLNVLKGLFQSWMPEAGEEALVTYCSGEEGVLSVEMGRGIAELALFSKKDDFVKEALLNNQPEQALKLLDADPRGLEFMARLGRFLEKNGHRALKEIELRSPRWREDPLPVIGMIRNYMSVDSEAGGQERKVEDSRRLIKEKARKELECKPLERVLGIRRKIIERMSAKIRYFAKLRENSRFYHIMGLDIVRRKIIRIEDKLMAQGLLKCRDDIFFLKLKEINELLYGALAWTDVEDRIRERRIEHIRLTKINPPKTIGIELKPKEVDDGDESGADILEGQSASPGIHEGRAHVILNPSMDVELAPGEVLVAPYTDPAWTPLFLTAGAAVVEVGSYLSHAGTVAREFGMPCVVDAAGCTNRIQTGYIIRVDGDRGKVTILFREGSME